MAGHVAHLNLRDHSLPYKHLIAEVIIDKNPQITTVINKVRDVGEDDEFRTFAYEVLAGPDNLNVEVKEENCTYRFDYSKVYWNSKLHTEHRRLLDMFKEGEAVCDVMAGIGPFALPAGKKHVFVWANDLNPHSYKYLTEGIQRNKVGNLVKPFNEDGRQFIRSAAADLYKQNGTHKAILPSPKLNKSQSKDEAGSTSTAEALTKTELQQPRTFAHYIMNLPASAVTFLPSFIGLYSSLLNESLNPPTRHSDLPLPMIHCHTFGVKPERPEDVIPEEIKICEEISKQLGAGIKRTDPEVTIHNVRDVAPRKTMFCASFRLPEEVAWRKP